MFNNCQIPFIYFFLNQISVILFNYAFLPHDNVKSDIIINNSFFCGDILYWVTKNTMVKQNNQHPLSWTLIDQALHTHTYSISIYL